MAIGNFEKGYRAILNQLFNINGIPLTINWSMESFGSKFSRWPNQGNWQQVV